jgi:hypothetical protein
MTDEVVLELYDGGEDRTPEEAEGQALSLRRELLELEAVASVGSASTGPAPAGSRGLDVAALGAMVVSVEPTITALSQVLSVVRSWLGHHSGHQAGSVRITVNGQSLELTAATVNQQQELVDQFIHTVGTH